jgi:hypothetical protein
MIELPATFLPTAVVDYYGRNFIDFVWPSPASLGVHGGSPCGVLVLVSTNCVVWST